MRDTWKLPSPSHIQGQGLDRNWYFLRVLLSFDGEPDISFVSFEGQTLLAVASDADDFKIRYVAAPCSPYEQQALFDRKVTLNEVLLKEELYVVDVSRVHLAMICFWTVDPKELVEKDLPMPKAFLPGGCT